MKPPEKGLRIRRFRRSDLDELMAVERASFGRWAYPPELMMEYFQQCPDLFLVAGAGPVLAGYIVSCRRAAFTELVSIAVAPAWRKAGVGTRLLRATVRKLRAEGQPRLNLTVKDTNRSAQKFYEGLGFRRVRTVRRYYEDGRDGILMTLSL